VAVRCCVISTAVVAGNRPAGNRAEEPLTCVARGGGRALEMMDRHAMDLLSTE